MNRWVGQLIFIRSSEIKPCCILKQLMLVDVPIHVRTSLNMSECQTCLQRPPFNIFCVAKQYHGFNLNAYPMPNITTCHNFPFIFSPWPYPFGMQLLQAAPANKLQMDSQGVIIACTGEFASNQVLYEWIFQPWNYLYREKSWWSWGWVVSCLACTRWIISRSWNGKIVMETQQCGEAKHCSWFSWCMKGWQLHEKKRCIKHYTNYIGFDSAVLWFLMGTFRWRGKALWVFPSRFDVKCALFESSLFASNLRLKKSWSHAQGKKFVCFVAFSRPNGSLPNHLLGGQDSAPEPLKRNYEKHCRDHVWRYNHSHVMPRGFTWKVYIRASFGKLEDRQVLASECWH